MRNDMSFGRLVQEDRVHRSIYTDPAIFEAERRKIFKTTWLYVGHESMVPNVGDYYCTKLAGEAVVMSHHRDGNIYVLFNRCGHRGAKVLQNGSGNAKLFSCMYHGWTFLPDGSLNGVPMRQDFPAPALAERDSGMVRLPRVETYRGFVFASFAADGRSLEEHLGPARTGIDEMVDRSPTGEIELWAGCHRYHFKGNWKLQLENMADMYHPAATHISTVGPDGRQFQRRSGAKGGSAPFFADNGEAVVAQTGVRGYPNGHSSEASLFREEQSGEGWDEYRTMLVESYGEERTREILRNQRHSMTIFPNLDVLIAQTSIRVVRPIAVDRTEVEVWPIRLKGAPDMISTDLVRFVNITHAAASFIQTDDLEAFERCQEGLMTQGADWVLVARGLGDEVEEEAGVLFGDRSSEVGQRSQHYGWRDLMDA